MHDKVIKLPLRKITKADRERREQAEHWQAQGFSWEVAVAASAICMEIDKLDRKLNRIERALRKP